MAATTQKVMVTVSPVTDDSKHCMSSATDDLVQILQSSLSPVKRALQQMQNPDNLWTVDVNLVKIVKTDERVQLTQGKKSLPVYYAVVEIPENQYDLYKEMIEKNGQHQVAPYNG